MTALREYLLGLCAMALACALLTKWVSKGTIGACIKLLSGLVMTLAVLAPLTSSRFSELRMEAADFAAQASEAAAEGEQSGKLAYRDIIKSTTRAYILDKAGSLGVSIDAQVVLSDGDIPVPVGVTLSGDVSPYAKSALTDYIRDQLGIGEEAQVWIS